MREYDIFLPLFFNDGSPVDVAKFQYLQQILLERFDGVTYFPQPNTGFWKMAGITYRDEIVIYRVLTDDDDARLVLSNLKDQLKVEFR